MPRMYTARLPDPLADAVDREVKAEGLKRSDWIRLVLARAVGDESLAEMPEASRAAAALRAEQSR